jgi:hypothetical protein
VKRLIERTGNGSWIYAAGNDKPAVLNLGLIGNARHVLSGEQRGVPLKGGPGHGGKRDGTASTSRHEQVPQQWGRPAP